MKKIIIFSFIIAVLLLSAFYAKAADYSRGRHGIGDYNIGESTPIVTVINSTPASMDGQGLLSFNLNDSYNISSCVLFVNGISNITAAPSPNSTIQFNLTNFTAGRYNWSVTCNNTLNASTEISLPPLTVNLMKNFSGATTNLSFINISNITNFVMDNPTYGKINFSDYIDLSQGYDLDKFTNISFNKIQIDSSAIPALNRSAALQIVGLTFSNPRILIDGVACPNDVCKKISYQKSGGVLIFNVSHWSAFSSEETPSESGGGPSGGASGGGGGGTGGGGTTAPVNTDFSISADSIKVVVKQGSTTKQTITLTNTGKASFDVNVDLKDIENFKLSPAENEITASLKPNEQKDIEIVFKALENAKPDIYPKRISFKGPSGEKQVIALIEVDSSQPLFDVIVNVNPSSKSVLAGENVLLEASLVNVRGFGRVDVNVEFSIKDLEGNTLATEQETVAVETQTKITRSLLVPSDLKPGTYVATAKVTYGDSAGTGSDLFEVKAKSIRLYPIQLKDYKSILLIIFVIIIFGIVAFASYQFANSRKRRPQTKEQEVKQLKSEDKSQKLKKEIKALEEAKKSGFISEESYQRNKKRIEGKLKNMK